MIQLPEKLFPDGNSIIKSQGYANFILSVFVTLLGLFLFRQYQHNEKRMDNLEQEVRDCYDEHRKAVMNVLEQNNQVMRDNARTMEQNAEIMKDVDETLDEVKQLFKNNR